MADMALIVHVGDGPQLLCSWVGGTLQVTPDGAAARQEMLEKNR